MSYQKKTPYGQYVAIGADDPWAEAASGTIAQTGAGAGHATTAAPSPGKPSTISQFGAGAAAFLKNLGAPTPVTPGVLPQAMPGGGMSTNTKLALAGGGALLLVLLLTRD